MKILIIEDDDQLRELIERALNAEGYEVRCARNGVEGDRIFVEFLPDVVLTDIFMPEKDGLEIIRTLTGANPAPKIIAMTGQPNLQTSHSYLQIAKKFGALKTLEKPFHIHELTGAIASL